MAKEIKVIQCPQCGSTQNTEIKPDFFKCNNCGTEYYLDNDDININYTYRNAPTPAPAASPARSRYAAFIFLGGIGLVVVISLLFHMMNVSDVSRFPEPGATSASSASASAADEEKYTYWSSVNMPFFQPGSTAAPLLIIIGRRQYNNFRGDETKNGIYISFYDILEKKELKATKIAPANNTMGAADVMLRTFANGDLYFILDRKKIYRINRSRFSADDVTQSLLGSQPKLQTGVATVVFQPDNSGDGFSILTNDGATYAYYPLVDRLYTQDEVNEAEEGMKNLIHGGKDSVYFTFTTHGFDFPDEKLQLLKISYKDNNGGPQDIRGGFNWRRDYGRSGIFTDADPYTKVLISKDLARVLRITGFKDITPGRLYFDPSVIYGDSKHLLIIVRVNAAPDASFSLQSLDPETGAVKWTEPMGEDKPDRVLPMQGGYVLVSRNSTRCIDTTGKTISEYKINQ